MIPIMHRIKNLSVLAKHFFFSYSPINQFLWRYLEMKHIILAFTAFSLLFSVSAIAGEQKSDELLALPSEDYRLDWSHVGSVSVVDSEAPGFGFHDVYAKKENIEAFKKNGVFPDGTKLIKEVRALHTNEQTTGTANSAGDINVWFVMVKDSTAQYEKSSKHWANGWGWALYKADNPKVNVSASAEETCIACHTPAENTDWVYTGIYPSLKK